VNSLHTPYTKTWTLPVAADLPQIRLQYVSKGIKIFIPMRQKHKQETKTKQESLPPHIKGWENPNGVLLENYSDDRLHVRILEEVFVEDYVKSPNAVAGFVDNRGTFQRY